MKREKEIIVQEETGRAFFIEKGRSFTVVDLMGKQVADLVMFNRRNKKEKLSTAVTIDNNASLFLHGGDSVFSNLYRRMATVAEDTVGKHDLIYPACSPDMYRYQYRIARSHPNCLENLHDALKDHSIEKEEIPNPINLFMNTVVGPDGAISVEEPLSKPGDRVSMTAEMDLIVAVAACSVRESKCNGYSCKPVKIIME